MLWDSGSALVHLALVLQIVLAALELADLLGLLREPEKKG